MKERETKFVKNQPFLRNGMGRYPRTPLRRPKVVNNRKTIRQFSLYFALGEEEGERVRKDKNLMYILF